MAEAPKTNAGGAIESDGVKRFIELFHLLTGGKPGAAPGSANPLWDQYSNQGVDGQTIAVADAASKYAGDPNSLKAQGLRAISRQEDAYGDSTGNPQSLDWLWAELAPNAGTVGNGVDGGGAVGSEAGSRGYQGMAGHNAIDYARAAGVFQSGADTGHQWRAPYAPGTPPTYLEDAQGTGTWLPEQREQNARTAAKDSPNKQTNNKAMAAMLKASHANPGMRKVK